MRTVLVTGTTSGIGRVTAMELARQGDRVVMANRNQQLSEALIADIKAETGNENVSFLPLDLASMGSVRSCAASFFFTSCLFRPRRGKDLALPVAAITSEHAYWKVLR